MQDWMNSAGFDREREDHWPRQWAEAFVNFATDEMENYVKALGLKFATVGWAERGGYSAGGHGNSVPRFHLSWGTGPEVVRIFAEPVKAAAKKGLVEFRFRHRVDEIIVDDSGAAIGVRGKTLEPTDVERGVASSRNTVDDFELRGKAVLITSGGIGGNVEAVKKNWPVDRLGPKVPNSFVIGVPAHVDGRMIDIAQSSGASIINSDRMWHYTERPSELEPYLARTRHSSYTWTVLSLARCNGKAIASFSLPRLRYPRHVEAHMFYRLRLLMVYPQQKHYCTRVCPLRVGAESGCHGKEYLDAHPAILWQQRDRACSEIHGERHGLYCKRQPGRPGS